MVNRMASLDPSATIVRALAPEPFDAFDRVLTAFPGTAPLRPLELARRRVAVLLGGDLDSIPQIVGIGPLDVDALVVWPTSLQFDAIDRAVVELAEQFVIDVASTTDDQRRRCFGALGDRAFETVQAVYVLDHGLRVRAAVRQLFGAQDSVIGDENVARSPGQAGPVLWEAIEQWMRAIAKLEALDPLTTELIRLRGARAHDCRLCRSLRNVHAVRAGADEVLFDQIDDYENSSLSERHKVALRLADAILWQPSSYPSGLVEQVHEHLSPAEAVEVVLDVARNATNKIAVAFRVDEAHVAAGVEYYDLDEQGDVVHGVQLDDPNGPDERAGSEQ